MKKMTKFLLTGALVLGFAPLAVMSLTSMDKASVQVKAEDITAPQIVSVGGTPVDGEGWGGAPLIMRNQAYEAQVEATGGELTFSSGTNGQGGGYMALPAGLSINASTGLISGTTTVDTGVYNSYIKAENGAGYATAIIAFRVGDTDRIPVISTEAGSLGTTYINSFISYSVSVQIDATQSFYNFNWSLKNGALPTGMELNYTNSATVNISGKPTEVGNFTFTLEAKNDCGSASKQFSINVIAGSVAPNIIEIGDSLGYGVVGMPYEYQLQATGTNTNENPIVWSKDNDFSKDSYDLGNGLSLSKTGLITGTPVNTTQVSFYASAKNSAGTDTAYFFIIMYDNGEATDISVSPSEVVVAKGKTKQFTVSLNGYGEVTQEAYWNFYIWDDDLGSSFPQPTDSSLNVNSSTATKTVTLSVGENEERAQFRVVAYSKPGNNGVKGYATVNVVDKDADIFEVTFNSNGGTGSYGPLEFVDGHVYTLPAGTAFTAPSGKHFLNWEVKIGSSAAVNKNAGETITITANTTVKAIWEDNPTPKHTVTYTSGSGTGSDYVVADVEEGSIHTLVSFATSGFVAPTGYQFAAWEVDGEQRQPGYQLTVDGDKSVTAIYELIPAQKYSVTYQSNGGTGSDYVVNNITSGSQHELVSLATAGFTAPNGKEFKCWSVGGEEKAPGSEITVDENKIVLAVWKESQVDPEKTLVSISLSGNQKTEFTVGDTFSAEGLVVTAHYSDESSEVVALNNVEITGYNMNQEGKQTVTVSYQGKTATYEITVKAKDTPVTPDDPVTPNKSSGLPSGAVVGIVIGSVLVLGVGGFALVWFVIKKKTWADFLALFKKK